MLEKLKVDIKKKDIERSTASVLKKEGSEREVQMTKTSHPNTKE